MELSQGIKDAASYVPFEGAAPLKALLRILDLSDKTAQVMGLAEDWPRSFGRRVGL